MSDLASDDAPLVQRAQAGDLEAFQDLYERYFGRIYDFCYQMVRHREDAADLTAETFLKAVERLAGLRDPAAFRGWLYAIARNAALNLIGRRGRTTAMDDDREPPAAAINVPTSGDPLQQAEQTELRELVWEAAATLDPRSYSIFEMIVRQGLDSGEVAQALDVKPSHAYVLISRMKQGVQEALGAVVLARVGRRDCAELDAVVAGFPDERSPALRKAVGRHVKRCDGCRSRRARYASPAALLGGVAIAAPAPMLKEQIATQLVNAWHTQGPPSGPRPSRNREPGAMRRQLSRLGMMLVLLLVAAALLAADEPVLVSEPLEAAEVVAATPMPAAAGTPVPHPDDDPAAVDDPTPPPPQPTQRRQPATARPAPSAPPVTTASPPPAPRPTDPPTPRPTDPPPPLPTDPPVTEPPRTTTPSPEPDPQRQDPPAPIPQ